MVRAVYGSCRGEPVRFTQNEATGRWEAAVPAAPDGTYILELWAEDDAGNVAFFATVKVAYDTSQLCTTFRILDVGAAFSMDEVRRVLLGDGVQSEPVPDALAFALAPEYVMSKVVKCEVCGE